MQSICMEQEKLVRTQNVGSIILYDVQTTVYNNNQNLGIQTAFRVKKIFITNQLTTGQIGNSFSFGNE